MNNTISNPILFKSNSYGFEIDLNEIRFYPSKILTFGGLILSFVLLIFLFPIIRQDSVLQTEMQIFVAIFLFATVIIIGFLLFIIFNNKPSIVLSSEGVFSKIGKIFWSDVIGIEMHEFDYASYSAICYINLSNGKKMNFFINFLPIESSKLLQVMEVYRLEGHAAAASLLIKLL